MVANFANAFESIKQRQIELYPITTSDDMEKTRELEAKYARGKYAIYCDQNKKVLQALSEEWMIHLAEKIPAIFIIDKQGIIRYTFFKEPSKDLPKVEEILQLIDTLVE